MVRRVTSSLLERPDDEIDNLYRELDKLQAMLTVKPVPVEPASLPSVFNLIARETDGDPVFNGVQGVEYDQTCGHSLSLTSDYFAKLTRTASVAVPSGPGTASAGVALDSSNSDHVHKGPALLVAQSTVAGGDTVANTVTEAAFTHAVYTVAANSLAVGDILRFEMYGVYSTDVVAPTLRGKVKLGSTVVLDTGALTAVAGITNGGWSARGLLVATAIGVGGSFEAQGYAEFATAATTALSVNVSNTAVVSVDTSISEALSVTITWGTANANNSITLRQFVLEKLVN